MTARHHGADTVEQQHAQHPRQKSLSECPICHSSDEWQKEHDANIRNQTLDDLLEELNEPNEWVDIPPTLSDVIEWIEENKASISTQQEHP